MKPDFKNNFKLIGREIIEESIKKKSVTDW